MAIEIIGSPQTWHIIKIVRYKSLWQPEGEQAAYHYGVTFGVRDGSYNSPTATTDYTSQADNSWASEHYPELPNRGIDHWFTNDTMPGVLAHPNSKSLNDALPGARYLLSVLSDVKEDALPAFMFAKTPVEPLPPLITPEQEAKILGPKPEMVQLQFDGQGWVVSAGGLIRPFRFAGRIAAEQYADAVGEKFHLPVFVVE